jgi:trk system potassium uptake protein
VSGARARLPGRPEERGLIAVALGGSTAACGVGMVAAGVAGALGDGRETLTFLEAGMIAIAGGLLVLRLAAKPREAFVRPAVGFGAVTVAWMLAACLGAVPLLLAGTFSSPLDALFEAMSGFTTTGSTLIDDIDGQPDAVLVWRSITQWLGGVGIVVLIVAIAPAVAPGLQRVFYSEASGMGGGRLTPRIADTAKIVAGVYAVLSAAAAVAYVAAGMGLFDAVNHAMTTIATGGFSTRTASIAAFDSVAVEVVAIVFMIASGVNFALYWKAIRRLPLMPTLAEVRLYLIILVAAAATITAGIVLGDEVGALGDGIRQAAFSATSVMTTTGYTTADFDMWASFPRMVLLMLMVIGGCAGSTAGGLKVIRVGLLAKATRQELGRQAAPRAVQVLRFGGRVFEEDVRRAVFAFFALYCAVFLAGVIGLAATGLGVTESISGVAATLNMVGPALGGLGALENFTALSDPARGIAIFLMLVGRLEILTVVAVLAALAGAALPRR